MVHFGFLSDHFVIGGFVGTKNQQLQVLQDITFWFEIHAITVIEHPSLNPKSILFSIKFLIAFVKVGAKRKIITT